MIYDCWVMGKPVRTRRDFLKLMGAGATVLAASKERRALAGGTPGVPNVLVILADDLGYGNLSSHGATDLKSPNTDGLVTAGMRFDNFYVNCRRMRILSYRKYFWLLGLRSRLAKVLAYRFWVH